MTAREWKSGNGASVPKDPDHSFVLQSPPGTDIWRPETHSDVFTAPWIYQSSPASNFKRMQVTVSAEWKTQYDQGGLILAFPNLDGPTRWIKAGIEYFNGQPNLGVVGCDRFSDWSICPMGQSEHKATLEAVRHGYTLWIHAVQKDGKRQPLREVKWAFLDLEDSSKNHEDVRFGVYVAKPKSDENNTQAALEVMFEDLEIDFSE